MAQSWKWGFCPTRLGVRSAILELVIVCRAVQGAPGFRDIANRALPYRGSQGERLLWAFRRTTETIEVRVGRSEGLGDKLFEVGNRESGGREKEEDDVERVEGYRVESGSSPPGFGRVEVYEIQRFDRKGLQRHVRWDIQRHYEVTRQKQNMVGNVCGWARPNSNG